MVSKFVGKDLRWEVTVQTEPKQAADIIKFELPNKHAREGAEKALSTLMSAKTPPLQSMFSFGATAKLPVKVKVQFHLRRGWDLNEDADEEQVRLPESASGEPVRIGDCYVYGLTCRFGHHPEDFEVRVLIQRDINIEDATAAHCWAGPRSASLCTALSKILEKNAA